jgi:hypothetical protein
MIKNKRSKSNFFNKNSNFPSLQDLSTKTTNKIGHRKSGFDRIYNKELNINNFIKQKNKFFISNFFDEKESKKFMDSKDLALKEIKLNDKIENYKNTNDKPNNSPQTKNSGFKTEKNIKQKGPKGQDNSHGNRRSKNIDKNNNNDKANNNEGINYDLFNTLNNCEDDSNDNNYIYKFIIDNVDEPEDNFHQKLKKEIKRVESKRYNNTNQSNSNIGRAFTSKKKDRNSIKVNASEKSNQKLNLFNLSEKTKNLMVGDDINVSSINDDILKSPEKKQTKIFTDLEDKKDDSNKNILNEAQLDMNNNSIEINSSHESLMSILSGLI